jgi:hypothetical protein
MRPFVVLAATLVLGLSLVACGGGGSSSERAAREGIVLSGVTGTNDAGVKAVARITKERSRTLYITVNIANGGNKTVLFRNPESDRVPGFKVVADGHEAQGADAGHYASTKSLAARLHELAPGAETEFEIKWTWDPPLAHETYPWALTITNMFINDDKLGDITLSYAPAAAPAAAPSTAK